jgi:hypothetical protein
MTDDWDNFESPQEKAERDREERSRDDTFGQKDSGRDRQGDVEDKRQQRREHREDKD